MWFYGFLAPTLGFMKLEFKTLSLNQNKQGREDPCLPIPVWMGKGWVGVRRLWGGLWQVILRPWANPPTIGLSFSRWKLGAGVNHFWDPSRATPGALGTRWGSDTSEGTGLEEGEVGTSENPSPTSLDRLLPSRVVGSLLLSPHCYFRKTVFLSVLISFGQTSPV